MTEPTSSSPQSPLSVFCSYVHKDNDTFGKVVDRLVRDLRSIYEAETGRPLHFFLDRESIGWGQNLREAIGESVESAGFLVAVISANYFESEWCRNEILSFYGKCKSLGVTDLILPIVVAGKSQIKEDSGDEVVRIVARIKYIDWTRVWQHDIGSEQWGTAISELAQHLVLLNEAIEKRLLDRAVEYSGEAAGDSSSDSPAPGNNEEDFVGAANLAVLRTSSLVDDIEKMLVDLRSEIAVALKDSDRYRSRALLDSLGTSVLDRAYLLGEQARDVAEAAVEADSWLRSRVRTMRVLSEAAHLDNARARLDQLRVDSAALNRRIQIVDAQTYNSPLVTSSIGMRAALSPLRAAMQSLRDIAHILDGWISWEV